MTTEPQRRLTAIVSADVVGYSRLMGADETGTLAALRAHRSELIDALIDQHSGCIVKTMGDGLLLEFPSVVDAVRCSLEIQNGMIERNTDVADVDALSFRIGVHLGDVIVEGDDILGDGVNVAARIEALADPTALRYPMTRTGKCAIDWMSRGGMAANTRSRISRTPYRYGVGQPRRTRPRPPRSNRWQRPTGHRSPFCLSTT